MTFMLGSPLAPLVVEFRLPPKIRDIRPGAGFSAPAPGGDTALGVAGVLSAVGGPAPLGVVAVLEGWDVHFGAGGVGLRFRPGMGRAGGAEIEVLEGR